MNNNTFSREAFEGFSGLGLSPRGKTSCRLDNFRVLADGSIQKREGIRWLASLPSAVRGICAFPEGGEDVILAAAGNRLHRISKSGQTISTVCFATEQGEVGSFVYGGKLYFLDGKELYRYEGGGVAKKIHGYTPLYGKEWDSHDISARTVNEPINALSPHIRIHYRVSGSLGSLFVGFPIESVDWLRVDGVLVDASRYSINNAKDGLTFQPLLYGVEFELSVTLPESAYKGEMSRSCLSAAVYEDFGNSRVFFYGGSDPTRFFVSQKLDRAAQIRDKELYPSSCGLYIPKGSGASFGDGRPITAAHRVLGRMVFFSSTALWASEELSGVEGNEILFSPICGHLGCSAPNAVVMTGGASPISVARNGIYRLKIDPDLLEECITECISEELSEHFDNSFFTGAGICHHRGRGELWFYHPSGKDGQIFLYSLDTEKWYCYRGIFHDQMFEFGGGIGFAKGSDVFLFDEMLSLDCLVDGEHNVEAVFESGWLDFGGTEADKRLESILLTADLSGGDIAFSLWDGEALEEERFSATDAVPSGVYDRRAPSGRFRAAKLKLCARGGARERIYRVELLAQKGKK